MTAEPKTREQWLAQRTQSIGASDAAAALGVSPFKSAYALWAEKTGAAEPDDLSDNLAVRLGLSRERALIEIFGEASGRKVECWPQYQIARHPSVEFMTCTPDAVQEFDGRAGTVQIKDGDLRFASDWQPQGSGMLRVAGDAPLHYQIQLAHEMEVTGLKCGTLVCAFGKKFLAYFDMERDERFAAVLVAKLADFMDMVRTKRPPDVDWTESTARAIAKAHPNDNGLSVILPVEAAAWDANLVRVKRHIALLERFKDEYENRLKAAIGDNTFGEVPGTGTVYSWKSCDRKEYTVSATTYRRLTRKAPKVAAIEDGKVIDADFSPRGKKLSKAQIRNRLLEQHNRCRWCNKTLTKRTATLEHTVPTAQGGADTWENWALACLECNQKRGDTGLHPKHLEVSK